MEFHAFALAGMVSMPTRPKPAVGSAGDPVAQLTCLGIEKYVGRYYSRSTVGPLITLLLPSDSGSLQDTYPTYQNPDSTPCRPTPPFDQRSEEAFIAAWLQR